MGCIDNSSGCGCHLSGGNCISVTGDGSAGNPYTLAPIIDPSASNSLSCGASGLLAVYAVPPGAMMFWPGAAAPSGWLLCQGQAVSRTTYAAIFAVIGTTFGAGDGVTTFNLPNLPGRTPVAASGSDSDFFLGVAGGAKTVTLTTAQIPSHSHAQPNGQFFQNNLAGHLFTEGSGATSFNYDSATATTGGGGSHNNLQPYLAVGHMIIKT